MRVVNSIRLAVFSSNFFRDASVMAMSPMAPIRTPSRSMGMQIMARRLHSCCSAQATHWGLSACLAGDDDRLPGPDHVADDVGVADLGHFQVEMTLGVTDFPELGIRDNDVNIEHARYRLGNVLHRIPNLQKSDHEPLLR